MSDNSTYSCTREMMEDGADKGQVGSALHAVFLHSYSGCIADVCFFLVKAWYWWVLLMSSHCWMRLTASFFHFCSCAALEIGPDSSADGRCLGLYWFLIVLGNKTNIVSGDEADCRMW